MEVSSLSAVLKLWLPTAVCRLRGRTAQRLLGTNAGNDPKKKEEKSDLELFQEDTSSSSSSSFPSSYSSSSCSRSSSRTRVHVM